MQQQHSEQNDNDHASNTQPTHYYSLYRNPDVQIPYDETMMVEILRGKLRGHSSNAFRRLQ